MNIPRSRLIIFCVCTVAMFPVLFMWNACTEKRKSTSVNSHVYASLSDSTAYVGMNTCRQCHPGIYTTFIQTGMGKSFDLASRLKSSGKYDSHALIRDSFKDLFYHPYWTGDSLRVDEFRLSGKDTVFKRTETIRYIVGSGQHTNSHMFQVNGYVYQIPATFYTQKGTWDLPPGFEKGFNSRFSRKIELECMSCHNGYPSLIAGSENKYDSIPHGIDCERCHGPGSAHLKAIQAGLLVDTATSIDYTIVNPSKLPVDRQLDVCQRCHIQGNAVLQDGKSFLDFRPGMKLSSVMDVFMPVYKGDDNAHIMASHAERLKMSKCYLQTTGNPALHYESSSALKPYKNALTCISCHNPHVSVKVTGTETYNKTCRNCHRPGLQKSSSYESANVRGCSAPEVERQSKQDNCVSCHMPKNGTLDIPHVVTTDHYIRKPVSIQEKKKIREFVKLVCINEKNPGNKMIGRAYLNYFEKFTPNPAFLDSAKRYFSSVNADSIRANFSDLVRWAFLKEDYSTVASFCSEVPDVESVLTKTGPGNEDAWTSYRIAESYAKNGDSPNAEKFFTRAVKLAPLVSEFRNKLASLEQDLGKPEEARKNYIFILNEDPSFVPAWINYGFLKLKEDHDVETADRYYEKALSLDPDNPQALINRAGTQVFKGNIREARNYLKSVLLLNPANRQAKELLSRIPATK